MGAQDPAHAGLHRQYRAALQGWHATGTNVAIFTLSNPEPHTLLITACGRLLTGGANLNRVDTFFLEVTNYPDFFLGPGQGVMLQAAFPQQPRPWKLRLLYRRDSREHSFSDVLRGWRETWAAEGKRTALQLRAIGSTVYPQGRRRGPSLGMQRMAASRCA